jgi:uncharacterized protein YqjF (DUF2071 family)
MRLPTIQGTIHRRILANFRVAPLVMQEQLPARFRPKLHNGFAVAGICMIRLEHIRPKMMPEVIGVDSENAAHRVAVLWDEDGQTKEGVFISRRDTDSKLNLLMGGRVFPGEHHESTFEVHEGGDAINIRIQSLDNAVSVAIEGRITDQLPSTSIFSSLAEASSFFEGGAVGYSVTHDHDRLDGLRLKTKEWRVEPLAVKLVESSYFSDETKFPKQSVEFDHALIMRNVTHEWQTVDDLYL